MSPIPPDTTTGLVECNWGNPAGTPTYQIPTAGFVSGYYLVKLSLQSPQVGESYIIFVVREDSRAATFLMNAAVTTYQAYNGWGGRSLYSQFPDGTPSATHVSFDRPYEHTFGSWGSGDFFDPRPERYAVNDTSPFSWPAGGFEYPMVRFLEREGYNVKYATDIDLHADSNDTLLRNVSGFLSVGHDEYWSKEMHDKLERARDRAGSPTNIAFFSGNSVFWIINVWPSPSGANRRIETHKGIPDPNPWMWQNCSLPLPPGQTAPPRCTDTGEESEQTLVGSITSDFSTDRGDIQFNASDFLGNGSWVLQGTALTAGSRLPGMVGYESQTVCSIDAPPRTYPDCYNWQPRRAVPPNQTIFAHSKFKARPAQYDRPGPEYLWADMSLYPAASGASVLSLGSPDWSLGLDIYTPPDFPVTRAYPRVHPAIAQITRNVLARFGNLSPPVPLTTPAYTISVSALGNRQYRLSWTNLAGRPTTDFVAVYDLNSNDDNPLMYARCDVPPGTTSSFCDVTLPTAGITATADYVTLDKQTDTFYRHQDPNNPNRLVPDRLRTIWRAAKSTPFTAQ